EGLAEPVLAKLELQPKHPQDHLAEPSPARPASLEALAQAGVAGIELPRGGVHHVLGVALDYGHHRLEAIERAGLFRARGHAREIAAQHRADRGARVGANETPRQP